MVDNIEKVLERGERLDLLVDKTEVLQAGALGFRREARRLKQTMWARVSALCLWVFDCVCAGGGGGQGGVTEVAPRHGIHAEG